MTEKVCQKTKKKEKVSQKPLVRKWFPRSSELNSGCKFWGGCGLPKSGVFQDLGEK